MKHAFAILLVLGYSAANAGEMYVSDKLVVNVYEEPDQASAKVDTLETGDAMEVLDRTDGGFAHVRLANGREGYVRASYLTSSVPAIKQVKELEKENAALKSKPAAAPAPTACPTVTAAPPAAKECPAQQVVPATTVVNGFTPGFASALAFAGAVVGFALGYRTLASRIRKKYRGLKVY
jgi:uncharacterized protein YgiM (DUF1202 family)